MKKEKFQIACRAWLRLHGDKQGRKSSDHTSHSGRVCSPRSVKRRVHRSAGVPPVPTPGDHLRGSSASRRCVRKLLQCVRSGGPVCGDTSEASLSLVLDPPVFVFDQSLTPLATHLISWIVTEACCIPTWVQGHGQGHSLAQRLLLPAVITFLTLC